MFVNLEAKLKAPMTLSGLTICAAFALAGLGFAPSTAHADLKICNKTANMVGVALGYKDQQGWASEGWWNVDPNVCQTLLEGPLIARYYYIFAIDYKEGGSWGGSAKLCTREKLFTIRGIKDCEKRNAKRTGFYEVDTGEELDWSISITSAQKSEKKAQ